MYAIISAGGKQHRVSVGETLPIDLIKGKQNGESIEFDQVLMLKGQDGSYKVGTPLVSGAKVTAKVANNGEDGAGAKGEKIVVFKKKRRKGYSRLNGHRQRYTHVTIESITG